MAAGARLSYGFVNQGQAQVQLMRTDHLAGASNTVCSSMLRSSRTLPGQL
jgi:hypothetical protein